jgi:hypothetical protein
MDVHEYPINANKELRGVSMVWEIYNSYIGAPH